MTGSRQKLIAIVMVALLLAIAAGWAYRPGNGGPDWDLMPPDRDPEAHGSTVIRLVPPQTPYERWLVGIRDRIPVFEGIVIEDIATVPLGAWPELGELVKGLYLRLADYQMIDGRLIELPAGGPVAPQRHLFEMGVYFLGGPGHTLFFRDGEAPLRVDWQAGSLLAVPLNVGYQHVNDSDGPLRLLAVTSFPFTINAADNSAFIYDNDFAFTDRFDGGSGYFESATGPDERRSAVNFVRDVSAVPVVGNSARGPGSTTRRWSMAGNSMLDLQLAETPANRYRKAHRHTSDVFILILAGEGYSLVWSGDDVEHRQRINWRTGTLFAPPTFRYHQHLNTGPGPARHLAISAPTLVRNIGLRFADQLEDDPPGVRDEWEATLRARQATPR